MAVQASFRAAAVGYRQIAGVALFKPRVLIVAFHRAAAVQLYMRVAFALGGYRPRRLRRCSRRLS